jgi:hypothetical protein
MLSSAIHGDVAESKYLRILVVASVGTKVPAAALKVPPVQLIWTMFRLRLHL